MNILYFYMKEIITAILNLIVDRFFKFVHFVARHKLPSASETADLLVHSCPPAWHSPGHCVQWSSPVVGSFAPGIRSDGESVIRLSSPDEWHQNRWALCIEKPSRASPHGASTFPGTNMPTIPCQVWPQLGHVLSVP